MTPRDPNATSVLEESPAFTQQKPGGVFVVIKGPDRGEQVVLHGPPIVIGSAPGCDLVLSDRTVSRRHATAAIEGSHVIVRDLESTNGSFTHGSRFSEIALGYGAELKLGKTVLKFLPLEEAMEPAEAASDSFGRLVGRDAKMRRLFSLLQDIAPNDTTVLIEGETGTGKELIAEEIHRHSRRADGPFVVFDCGAVPRELIESALFGHVKGAFTGAISDRKGAFSEAHGGTIFLDEIGELALDLQPALLRALDKRAIRRVGANHYEQIDVRVIAATHRDLREEVARKTFREDLYYRLAVIRVHIPPLRERGRDIDLLVEHFVRQFAGGRELTVLNEDLQRLRSYTWPGNVRELRNVIERACVLSKGDTLNIDDALGEGLRQAPASFRTGLPFKEAKGQLVEQFEREYIIDLMKRHRMNLSAASREAQIDRKHLRELLRKYGLDMRGETHDGGE
ncbi:MAG: sigma 54-dependent Fis family transcriptional regulator [Myxococcales bacterium]|nr:sigma 54-interacting transcriptional regulator [Myxococcota bacterium]MDW8280529.1 sigma 54-dependent Fis family transcriptional regulator [Myxococcales bacterium]